MQKTAYLTIDDAPSKDMKKKVDFLASKGIPAVWFCVGSNLRKRRAYAIRAIETGSILGNHSYSHRRFSTLSLSECFEEIRKTDEIIDEIYNETSARRPAKFFRFPYGDRGDFEHLGFQRSGFQEKRRSEGAARKEGIQGFLKGLGYTQPRFEKVTYAYYRKSRLSGDVDWLLTYDVMEWATFGDNDVFGIRTLEDIFHRMADDFPEGSRGLNYAGSEDIIVIHDHDQTTRMFRPIVERLAAKGVVFKLPPLK
jgi:peptidoglycan/xylan/chitin deacetylase (PgdA/CDA1 family)